MLSATEGLWEMKSWAGDDKVTENFTFSSLVSHNFHLTLNTWFPMKCSEYSARKLLLSEFPDDHSKKKTVYTNKKQLFNENNTISPYSFNMDAG